MTTGAPSPVLSAAARRARLASRTLAALLVCGACAAICACASNSRPDAVALASDPANVAAAYDIILEAQDAERREKPEEAVSLYREGLSRYREFPAAWNNLGSLLMDQKRYLEAVECFQAAGELAPKDPRPPFNQGLAWDRAGYLDDALEFYDRALDRDPQYLPALRGAIRAERLQTRGSQMTLDRLKTALLLEQDPKWREWLELQRLRLETELANPAIQPKPRAEAPTRR